MECHAFCTASSFKIKPFFEHLKGRYKATLFRDVIHLEVNSQTGEGADIFYFPYGAMISWGLSKQETENYLEEANEFHSETLKNRESDRFTFSYGDDEKFSFEEDELRLPDRSTLTKLAVSHGVAQSVKLGTFEHTISETFEKTRQIPEDLAKQGKIPLSRKEIRRKMGELFIERSSINLHVDVLDTPEFFWEHPELEPIYKVVANELDIKTRGQVLNQRLDVIRELFEMLGNELNHQHSSRLEIIIILLILFEVVFSLLTNYNLL